MKDILWMGDTLRVLRSWRIPVRAAAGYQLHRIQQGDDPDDWKPMSSIGAGVKEIRLHIDGEHRIIYLARFVEGVYVLHAFQKKAQKTPKHDIDLAKKRYSEVINGRRL